MTWFSNRHIFKVILNQPWCFRWKGWNGCDWLLLWEVFLWDILTLTSWWHQWWVGTWRGWLAGPSFSSSAPSSTVSSLSTTLCCGSAPTPPPRPPPWRRWSWQTLTCSAQGTATGLTNYVESGKCTGERIKENLDSDSGCFRAFQTAQTYFGPQHIFFLGDLFDEGLWCPPAEFEYYVKRCQKNRGGRFYALFRFHSLFPSGKESRIHVLPGNHDMGFHYALSPYLDKRFKSAFKTKAVQLKVAKLICAPDPFLGYRPRSICDDKQHGLWGRWLFLM